MSKSTDLMSSLTLFAMAIILPYYLAAKTTSDTNYTMGMSKSKEREKKEQDDDNRPGGYSSLFRLIVLTVQPFFIDAKVEMGYWRVTFIPSNWGPRLDLQVYLVYMAWLCMQFILYMVPFGGKVVDGLQLAGGHRLQYRLNGLFVLCINILVMILLYLSGWRMSSIVNSNTEIVTVAFVIQFLLSFLLLFRGKPKLNHDVNPATNNGNIVLDWIFGKSLNPRFGFLDLKYICIRSCIVASVMYSFSILALFYEYHNTTNMTLLLAVGMLVMLAVDLMWFERSLLFLREILVEGCGYSTLLLLVNIPMGYNIVINYIARTNHSLPLYMLVIIATVYLLGYWIFRGSNEEKNRYRLNPRDEACKVCDVISTDSGKGLLVSGWWGFCRHPNYLGSSILNIALCLPAGNTHILPYINLIIFFLHISDRETVVEYDCKQKYGEDWDKYCHRVKNRFLPFFY